MQTRTMRNVHQHRLLRDALVWHSGCQLGLGMQKRGPVADLVGGTLRDTSCRRSSACYADELFQTTLKPPEPIKPFSGAHPERPRAPQSPSKSFRRWHTQMPPLSARCFLPDASSHACSHMPFPYSGKMFKLCTGEM